MKAKDHPVFQRARAQAAYLGSKAESLFDVAQFLAKHRVPANSRFRSTYVKEYAPYYRSIRIKEWREQVALRKSDAEFKRGLAERVFGVRLAGRLFRELKKDYAKILRGDLGCVSEFVDRRKTRIERINRLRKTHGLRPVKFGKGLVTVPISIRTALGLGIRLVQRGKDWGVSPTFKANWFQHEGGWTRWKNGTPKEYTRAVNENYIRSFAAISSRSEIVYFLSDLQYQVALPPGYYWDIDQNGLRAVKEFAPRDDFHPEASNLISPNAASELVEYLEANRAQRLEEAAREAAALAEMEGVWVCVADSRRAGNCDSGTLSFARRHSLDPTRHYLAPELVKIANGDAGRVRLAISAAVHRHRRDLARGYSILTEHQ